MKIIKVIIAATLLMLSGFSIAEDAEEFIATQEQLILQAYKVNDLQNKVLLDGSTEADAKALFDLFSDDFVYVHEQYGSEYTKEHLYRNTIKFMKAGKYIFKRDRYTIVELIPGRKAVALRRLQHPNHWNPNNEYHFTVFEFDGLKVKRIVEYW
ncbi:hypothetical protein tinsulaeT_29730 [Thalassotalea insulae]|uniref:Nuclear transport factor 2 family protein n=2 Tax=Thalassotalea insulae TaxID=2056778 RepID=A0ABQ6GUN9_9GAMM|nr:hypothetical protein tinsulaeT_29730 [Thalassotalea insulae]